VLDKVRDAGYSFVFVSRTDADKKAERCRPGVRHGGRNDPESVVQGGFVVHGESLLFK
jgi:hypothetical protein